MAGREFRNAFPARDHLAAQPVKNRLSKIIGANEFLNSFGQARLRRQQCESVCFIRTGTAMRAALQRKSPWLPIRGPAEQDKVAGIFVPAKRAEITSNLATTSWRMG